MTLSFCFEDVCPFPSTTDQELRGSYWCAEVDDPMRHLAMLCNEGAARKLQWVVEKQMVVSTPKLEELAAGADEVWFIRSKIWNWVLVDLRSGKLRSIPRLASYLKPRMPCSGRGE